MRRSNEIAKAYVISLTGHLKALPCSVRESVKDELVELLSSYEFTPRSRGEPPHPENIYHRKKGNSLLNIETSEGLATLTLTQMQPYYNSGTQNRILRLIICGLKEIKDF